MATLLFRSAIFLLLLFQLPSSSAGVSSWSVKHLPGFSGPLPFELETGYVSVGDSDEVELFYYFVKSQGNPQTDPLMSWFDGGPGCSGFTGLFVEIGPLNLKVEPYNGSLPQIILNPHTWTKNTSILFVDSVVYSGFSYPRTPHGAKKGDFIQINQSHQFLRKWLAAHPEFISNPFYVGGVSYAGMIVPPITQAISEGNKYGVPVINLQGYIVGNPVSVRGRNENLAIPFAHGMNLIPTQLYESLTSSCKGEYVKVDPNNVDCIKHVSTYKKCVSRINVWCILRRFCKPPSERPEPRRSLYNSFDDQQLLQLPQKTLPQYAIDCEEYKGNLGYYWANDDRVQEALHIRKGTIPEWDRCNTTDDYEYEISNVVPYHANLSLKGYRSLVFSGDHDMRVPTIDTKGWVDSLNYSIVDDWRPWFILDDQVLGYTMTYANNMTFATIKGGGHTPQYTAYQSGIMFNRWIVGEAL
ncbi:hypothetical protein IC582_015440 [Cucumis melo]